MTLFRAKAVTEQGKSRVALPAEPRWPVRGARLRSRRPRGRRVSARALGSSCAPARTIFLSSRPGARAFTIKLNICPERSNYNSTLRFGGRLGILAPNTSICSDNRLGSCWHGWPRMKLSSRHKKQYFKLWAGRPQEALASLHFRHTFIGVSSRRLPNAHPGNSGCRAGSPTIRIGCRIQYGAGALRLGTRGLARPCERCDRA